ncbi:GTP cyclohydrolase II [Mesobaculum littorinae]|uniref:GTP cyclohydrolase-2 n=1 Tax=Mesobaculum littorinae TaxID=2486419 RepID=A0A438ADA3_9RHOB|nr:GTP cyclohydrolase II [Mesobaculum littorinae]RVV96671.1 GTP cyclohydrolase II [Mesobaculum littorinae]
MTYAPTDAERIARARSDLRMGLPVILSRGGVEALVAGAETLKPARLTALAQGGAAELAITHRRAETLKVRVYDDDIARLPVPEDITPRGLRAIIDPAGDLATPLKGPFRALRGGEAGLHRAAIQLVKSARLLPAAVLRPVAAGEALARDSALTRIVIGDQVPFLSQAPALDPVISARLPMAAAEAGRLHIFRPDDGGEEHYAVEIGQPDRSLPTLTRLHSACFTGDVLGSLKCDCGPQLRGALAQMAATGSGVLLYLNQEGRGIGLANKMRAYSLQDQGFDTVEANHRLGFEDDERDFRIGAAILRKMGFAQVRLLTNNPAKVAMLEKSGVAVTERVPLKIGRNPLNESYLATKAAKSGHLL